MKIALGIEYDGSFYRGWQRQENAVSVQAALEKALSSVADHPIETMAAGRTDAGVHASEQVVHFETKANRSEFSWVMGTNSALPASIRVLWACQVAEDFDARRSAFARRYRYFIFNNPIKPALLNQQVTWYYHPLDVEKMHQASQVFVGEHDFSSLRAAECQSKSPIREVISCACYRSGPLVIFEVVANAFLHHMVRNMVGVLLQIGVQNKPFSWVKEVLLACDRRKAGITAPANGLYLIGVDYPKRYNLPSTNNGPWFMQHTVAPNMQEEMNNELV